MKQAPQACSQTEGSFVEFSLGPFQRLLPGWSGPGKSSLRWENRQFSIDRVPGRQSGPPCPVYVCSAILKDLLLWELGKGIKGTINM